MPVPRPSLASLGEFGLIDHLARLLPDPDEHAPGGIGDDVAAVRLGERILLATTDALIEGVHFRRDWTSPEDLGWKALAANLSDIAAAGGEPRFALISLGLPADTDLGWSEGFYRGMADLSRVAGCPVVGGDTIVSPDRIYLNLAVVGEAAGGRHATRTGARPGDVLLVTGTLGDSLGGYYLLKEGSFLIEGESMTQAMISCLNAHRRPEPRLAAGRAAVGTGRIHAMMDVSDGLSGDVRHIAERSGVGILLEEESLPVSDSLVQVAARLGGDARAWALAGGEDYELLMAVAPEDVAAVRAAVEPTDVSLTAVGRATAPEAGLVLRRRDGTTVPLPLTSWDHFRADASPSGGSPPTGGG